MPFLKLRPRNFGVSLEKVSMVHREPTNAEKKRRRFRTMFTLHALMCNAKIKHENEHTLTCSGYIKTKDRF